MSQQNNDQNNSAAQNDGPHFSMQKIYLKKNIFESPNSARIFTTDWKPETTLDLNITHTPLEDDRYEVVLTVEVTAQNENMAAFNLIVDQAAIFAISGFPEDRLDEAINSACPSIMFPYLREAVDHSLLKAGYPPLMLAPINFDAMYKDKKAQAH